MTMLRLRLHAWLGWGRAPDDLRVQSAQLFKAAWVGIVCFAFVMPLIFLAIGLFNNRFGAAYISFLFTTRFGLFYGAIILALSLYLWIPAVSFRRLAQRGETQPPTNFSGRCYEVLQGKSGIFAPIGVSAEAAKWYHLPLAWEAVVEPDQSEYELTVNPATGFVERLRRLGDAPKEVRQYSETEIMAGYADASYYLKDGEQDEDENTGKATREQRRELKRELRSFGPGRGLGPRSFSIGGAVILLEGLALVGLVVWLSVVLFGSNQVRFEAGAKEAAVLFIAILVLCSLSIILYGVRLLWIWRRLMGTAGEEPGQIEGVTLYWMPYGNPGYEPRADTLLRMRADDGSTEVYRINRRWEHRVRTPGKRFRVTYLPTTHRVLDVRMVDGQSAA